MRPDRARALSRRGTRMVIDLANDYAYTYAPYIQVAVREVGHNYRQVAIDSPGSDSSSSTLEMSKRWSAACRRCVAAPPRW